ncbi:hypothetical protein [Mucilaginibacter segetis]|uniref:Outer membrane protein beta-barrel domain-containing protein n=1 Tax=Mucilaginibacter segetis TaxID=2793071 RepID=A0A934PSH5_9SPHI|nr:hypothetical protein [Mucilaginibacter segetis]MBK0378386.1 hypothetical protein [Mucilaginibacter segetis]
MKKFILLAFLFASFIAKAQVAPQKAFSVGLDLGFPSNSIYNVAFGGYGKAEVPIANSLSLSVTAGYTSVYFKSSLIGSSSSQDPIGIVPLKAGAKYFFSPGFYAEGELGTAIETNYDKDKLFAYSIGPGFIIPTGKHTGVDFGFRYENWGSGRIRLTAFRVAYRLGW